MNKYIIRQTNGKRFLAGLLDTIFVFLLSIILYFPAVHIASYNGLVETMVALGYHGERSGLYVMNELDGFSEISDPDLLPEALFTFYVDEVKSDGTIYRGYSPILTEGAEFNSAENYYVAILGKGKSDTLFDFTEPFSKPYEVPVLAGKEGAALRFYQTEIAKAHTIFNGHPDVAPLYFDYFKIYFLTLYLTLLSASFVLIVLIPFLNKNKVTFGKMLTKSIVVNKLGYRATTTQLLLRNLAIFVFSFAFFFMPFHIVSFFLLLISKSKASLYDRLTLTTVIEKSSSLMFYNVDEENRYRKALAQQLLEIERRKTENRNTDILNFNAVNNNQ